MLSTVCLLLATTLPVRGAFTEFFFAGNVGIGDLKACPKSSFGCDAPSVCAFDDRTEKYYCCIPGSTDAVCWGPSSDCDGGDKRTPSGSQQACSTGINTFCCLKSSETCTETADQTNICWSKLDNPLISLNATAVNETAQSLIAARPSAPTYAISLSALQALAPTTAAASSATPSASGQPIATTSPSGGAQATAASPPSPIATKHKASGLSGGAIGGLVGGIVGGLALLGLAGFLFWRRKKNGKRNPYEPANAHIAPTYPAGSPSEMDSNQAYTQGPATEKYGHAVSPVSEVPADRAPVELPAGTTYNR